MKKNIALIAGGDSGEAEISFKSAQVIKKNIDNERFNVYRIFMHKGKWVYIDDNDTEYTVDKNTFTIKLNENIIKFDCAFIAIHGTPGEDGKLQGYFDILSIPYTTCDMFTSALTFNKHFCNQLVREYGATISKSVVSRKYSPLSKEQILNEIKLPCFVKPNKGGSSIGTTKVKESDELENALALAFEQDDEVLIEEFIPGTEITCGVIRSKGEYIAFPITEIVSKTEFFDYKAKYTTGMSDEITPARISKEIELQCKEMSLNLYKKLNCKGVVRFDYILSNNKLYFLEVNTVPGQSENSIVPQQARAMGMSIKELYSRLIDEALI